MRRISEEIAGWFPQRYRDPELILLPVDPHRVHAYWSVDQATLEQAQREAGSPYAPLVLRVHATDAAERAWHQVQVPPDRSSCYVGSLSAARTYHAELGMSTPDGRIISLLRSNAATLPPNAVSEKRAPEAVDVRAADRAFPLVPLPPSPGRFDAWTTYPPDLVPPEGDATVNGPPAPPQPAVVEAAGIRHPAAGRRRLDPAVLGKRVEEPVWESLASSSLPSSPSSRSKSDDER